MIIPTIVDYVKSLTEAASDTCPMDIIQGAINLDKREVTSATVKSGWNSCMDKTWCKVVVIVFIVIGGLLVFWIVSLIFNALFCGFQCLTCCCAGCCGPREKKETYYVQNNPGYNQQGYYGNGSRDKAYNNPNMYYHPQR